MTISQFFDIHPWIKVRSFATAMGIDPGALNRYRNDYTDPPDWVIEKMQEYLDSIAARLANRPLTLPKK